MGKSDTADKQGLCHMIFIFIYKHMMGFCKEDYNLDKQIIPTSAESRVQILRTAAR